MFDKGGGEEKSVKSQKEVRVEFIVNESLRQTGSTGPLQSKRTRFVRTTYAMDVS